MHINDVSVQRETKISLKMDNKEGPYMPSCVVIVLSHANNINNQIQSVYFINKAFLPHDHYFS